MKTILLFIIILTSSALATNVSLVVKDVNIKSGKMYVKACLKEDFTTTNPNKPCQAAVIKTLNGSNIYTILLNNVPEGEYAFYGYIDENGNGKLDTNFIGIPKETVMFKVYLKGEPKFDEVKTTVKGENQTVEIFAQ